jgi:hypothetical protein
MMAGVVLVMDEASNSRLVASSDNASVPYAVQSIDDADGGGTGRLALASLGAGIILGVALTAGGQRWRSRRA